MSTQTLPAELAGCKVVSFDVDRELLAEVADADRSRVRPRGDRTRQCASKRSYGRRAAHRAARVLRENQGEAVHAYDCPHCGGFHVGHEPVAY